MELAERHRETIGRILARSFGARRCTVYLFGSRARGTSRPASDIDLAVDAGSGMEREVAVAREAFEESTIPYEVDLVDLSRAGNDLVAEVRKEGVVLWQN